MTTVTPPPRRSRASANDHLLQLTRCYTERLRLADLGYAPATPAEPALEEDLDGDDDGLLLGTLMGRLIDLWDPTLTIPEGANICETLAQHDLQCFRGKGQWSDLDQINPPALLTPGLGRRATQFVLARAPE